MSDGRIPLPGSVLPIHDAERVGDAPPDEPIDVFVHLRRKPSSPGLPAAEEVAAGARLSREELVELHGADPGDAEAVAEFLADHGLDVQDVDLATRIVHARGPAGRASAAFGVELGIFRHSHYEDEFRAHLGPVLVPAELEGVVIGVHGLDARPKYRPHVKPVLELLDAVSPEDLRAGTFVPPQVAALYDFPSGTGAGQAVGVIELGGANGGGYDPQVLQRYFEWLGVPMPNVVSLPVAGSSNNPDGPAAVEVYLDVEVVGSVAPGAEIRVYFAGDLGVGVKAAVHDAERELTTITISYGGVEQRFSEQERTLMHEALHEASVLGIPVFVSSGDNGSGAGRCTNFTVLAEQANVSYPSTDPFAIACGGTKLVAGPNGGIESETVWNEVGLESGQVGECVPGGAGGGGVSVLFDVPSYQSAHGIHPQSVNPDNAPGRGVPDVCGNAASSSGYVIEVSQGRAVVGGTSAVAPLWAALAALLGEATGSTGPLKGFDNTFLYANPTAFRPVLQGDNNTSPPVGGYRAGPGWNPCGGLGSPNGALLLAALRPGPPPKKGAFAAGVKKDGAFAAGGAVKKEGAFAAGDGGKKEGAFAAGGAVKKEGAFAAGGDGKKEGAFAAGGDGKGAFRRWLRSALRRLQRLWRR